MEDLLTNHLVYHYRLPAPIITNWFIKTDEKYFEVEDTNAGEINLHTTRGLGMGKFSNADDLVITIFNYDKFITSIQDEPFKSGRKRCDVLLDSNNNRYFILGEFKDRKILNDNKQKNVRRDAKEQLLSSLQTILEVPEIVRYSTLKVIKRCCYFNKQSPSPDPLTA